MGQFGQELRREREGRGITIGHVCAVTKVSARHVDALEEERFEELPGGVFRKGIMRSYITAVGLDETLWVERFESKLRECGLAAPLEPDWSEFAENVKRNRSTPGPKTGMRWVGVVLMLLALLVCGWFTWKYVLHSAL